ncbi:conserved hypothetical protein [Verrucomicrobiia bacterium DG1235]|nr:conserved hypothetical protein [Verrucomicrobiae bacterium DG1235]
MDVGRKIVFFDGVCGVCNWSVDWLLRLDDERVLWFSPIQGETAKALLPKERREDVDTICFWDGERLFTRTDALLEIGRALGGVWRVFYVLKVIPAEWRDWAYDAFARRRYKWFGKREACRIPTAGERERFLD